MPWGGLSCMASFSGGDSGRSLNDRGSEEHGNERFERFFKHPHDEHRICRVRVVAPEKTADLIESSRNKNQRDCNREGLRPAFARLKCLKKPAPVVHDKKRTHCPKREENSSDRGFLKERCGRLKKKSRTERVARGESRLKVQFAQTTCDQQHGSGNLGMPLPNR